MKSHGLKPPKYCISLSQINTHTIKNPYSIYTLSVRWSFFIKFVFLRYKNHFFGIYKCRWRMRTTVYLRIMQCFSDIFKSFPHTRGGDPNVETMTRCDMCFSPHTWGWPLEKSFRARPFPHTRGGDPWDFQYFSTFPHTRGGDPKFQKD